MGGPSSSSPHLPLSLHFSSLSHTFPLLALASPTLSLSLSRCFILQRRRPLDDNVDVWIEKEVKFGPATLGSNCRGCTTRQCSRPATIESEWGQLLFLSYVNPLAPLRESQCCSSSLSSFFYSRGGSAFKQSRTIPGVPQPLALVPIQAGDLAGRHVVIWSDIHAVNDRVPYNVGF